ncbi:hypothetical protein AAT17_02970 [Nonlabens sp. MIC269]|uniref:DUF2339 domain-containing protein n=1 Tax=Nonlabens sp. MIC269 TaxID=1476901 RepID=UPI00072222C4|nr:DUF2339 domain-containing protein [Nonlabens sp. MIC269]ALM20282.1 hypothetical protein AAT17_02970 [Nonlabens sp. MIC269]
MSNDRLNDLIYKLQYLERKQEEYARNMKQLREEIQAFKKDSLVQESQDQPVKQQPKPVSELTETVEKKQTSTEQPIKKFDKLDPQVNDRFNDENKKTSTNSLEKFVGENLLNKIGILITIIGVIIGVKYSIENNLISPLTRIILGYITGISLLGIGIKLKKKYEPYSAVLVSGAMCVMYFVTFSGYSFYHLYSQSVAFILMALFTLFTVITALKYDRSIIAHLGLIGAYAVPFFLSDGSGRMAILFSYISLINFGILAIAFKKEWKSLYYVAFGATWLIFITWSITSYDVNDHLGKALFFSSLIFLTFYTMFIVYKLVQKEVYTVIDIVMLLANSLLFFATGYLLLESHSSTRDFTGLFTLLNAVIHFIVAVIIHKKQLASNNLFYLVAALVLSFITLAIPVQLDGEWVTVSWTVLAAVLFAIGRIKNIAPYEKIAYAIIILATFSLIEDWDQLNREIYDSNLKALWHTTFFTGLFYIIGLGSINYLYFNKKRAIPEFTITGFFHVMHYVLPSLLIMMSYVIFKVEIDIYWEHARNISSKTLTALYGGTRYDRNVTLLHDTWLLFYSFGFVALLAGINLKWIKNKILGQVNCGFIGFSILVLLIAGLWNFSELRDSYLDRVKDGYTSISLWQVNLRYLGITTAVLLHYLIRLHYKENYLGKAFAKPIVLFVHTTILWILSSELLHWMDFAGVSNNYKLGLSILWAVYSLGLVILGIWKRKQYIRITAITLFGLTLVKLFFYDLTYLNTISKTIVFISIGALMLIASFLYNKFNKQITDESEE